MPDKEKKSSKAVPSSPPKSTARVNADKLKVMGNEYFKKGRFSAAIEAYTEAITLDPSEAVFFTNRALCYHKKKEWARVVADCTQAVQLSTKSVKGYYLLGVAETELGNFDAGDGMLQKALSLTATSDPYRKMVEQAMRLVKKRKWEKEKFGSDTKDKELKQYLTELMNERYEIRLSTPECGSREAAYSMRTQHEAKVAELEAVFEDRGRPQATEIPDYLLCKITFEPYIDPVITPSGQTYERSALLQHLSKVGLFDPTTREPMTKDQIWSNIAIRDATRAFLDNNPSLWQDLG